jgi:hypothetical protein
MCMLNNANGVAVLQSRQPSSNACNAYRGGQQSKWHTLPFNLQVHMQLAHDWKTACQFYLAVLYCILDDVHIATSVCFEQHLLC